MMLLTHTTVLNQKQNLLIIKIFLPAKQEEINETNQNNNGKNGEKKKRNNLLRLLKAHITTQQMIKKTEKEQRNTREKNEPYKLGIREKLIPLMSGPLRYKFFSYLLLIIG